MSDDLTGLFLKKVAKLRQDICNSRDYNDAVKMVQDLETWLVSDRYIVQHRTCQAFLTYLWRHDGNFKDRTGFVSWIKCKLKFADINITEAMIDGQKVIFKKFLPWSLSFGSCSQKKHNYFFNKLQEFSMVKYKVDFNIWLVEYETNPNLLQ